MMSEPQNTGTISGKNKLVEESRLEDQRQKLRDEIRTLRQLPDNANTDSILLEKQLVHNEIVDAIYTLQIRTDPMEKLPYDIWHDILAHLSSMSQPLLKEGEAFRPLQPIGHLIPLTKVSRRWRSFLLSEPTLWNIISLYPGQHNTEKIILWQLELSASLPLTIIFAQRRKEQWTRIHSELVKHRERIESVFVINIALWRRVAPLDCFEMQMLQDLAPLPNLLYVGYPFQPTRFWADIYNLLNLFHSVKKVINLGLDGEIIDAMKEILDLGEIITFEGFSEIVPLLIGTPGVRKVSFQGGSPDDKADSLEALFDAASNCSPQWTSLTYHSPLHPFPTPLLHRLPLLTNLDIVTDFQTIKAVFGVLHRLSNLTTFKSKVFVPSGDALTPPETISPNYNISSLDVVIQYTFRSRQFPLEGNDSVHPSQKEGIIAQMFLTAMPVTDNIKLSISAPPPFLSFVLVGWSKFQSLHLSCTNARAVTTVPLQDIPTTVKHFSLDGVYDMASVLFSSSAEVFRCGTDSMRLSATMHIDKPVLRPNQWLSLRILDVFGDIFKWEKSSLPCLSTVTIRDRTAAYLTDNEVTSFIHALARCPDHYPFLEEIILDECPEWDIFIIMLEYRNLLVAPGIKPIRKVVLPCTCPLIIRRVIGDILKGKWSQRPSNKDLSLAGNAETILDMAV
jgi:hypothetical protein